MSLLFSHKINHPTLHLLGLHLLCFRVWQPESDCAVQVWDVQEDLPAGLILEKVENGAAEMRNGEDFAIKLILVPAPPPPGQSRFTNCSCAQTSQQVKSLKAVKGLSLTVKAASSFFYGLRYVTLLLSS